MVDIEKLKEICGDEALSETTPRYITTSEYREAFEAFVEELSPAAVLELIAENERFKAERDQLRAEAEALRAQANALHQVGHALGLPAGSDLTREVQPAIEALRKDAALYRLLRKGAVEDVAVVRGLGAMDYGMSAVVSTYSEEIDGDDLDAAIDAAMAAKEGE